MGINNLSFITPITNPNKIVLEKEYSKKIILQDGSNINLASNIGKKKNQQDSIAVVENNGYLLMLVADGMGGLEQGEVASYITAKTIKEWLESLSLDELKKINEATLSKILTHLISTILKKIPKRSGTTLNMSIVCPEITLIANIGDSRSYTIKEKKITLRTEDDSLSFSIFQPTTEEERNKLRFFRKNNIITNAITKKQPPKITITAIKNDDYDILCHMTDGVSDILTENLIRICLLDEKPATSLVDETLSNGYLYNPNGGYEFTEFIYPVDNTTAIVYTKKKIKE